MKVDTNSARLRNEIVIANMGLVRHVAHRYKNRCSLPYEDLEQIGCIGLIKAIDRFRPEAGAALSSYAIPYIRGEILHFLERKNHLLSGTRPRKLDSPEYLQEMAKLARVGSLDVVIADSQGRSITLGETVAAKQNESDLIEDLEYWLDFLSPKEASLLLDWFFDELSGAALSKKYGYKSESGVSISKTRAIRKLQKAALVGK